MAVTVHVVQRFRSWRAGLRAGSSATGGTMAISDNWSSEGICGSLVMVLGMRWIKGMTGGGEGVSSMTGRRCGCDMELERNWMDRNNQARFLLPALTHASVTGWLATTVPSVSETQDDQLTQGEQDEDRLNPHRS